MPLNGSFEKLSHFHITLALMLVKVFGSAVMGVDAITVTIEADAVNAETPSYPIVGMPDNAVKESLERIFSALKNNGYSRPRQKVVINMAPADIRKEGAAYDLSLIHI